MEKQSIGSAPYGLPLEHVEHRDPCRPEQVVDLTRAAMQLLTGKWKAEITWSLRDGKLRFNELLRSIPGITQHMLTVQLRDLERHGLLTRTIYAEVPPRVEYELTPAAMDLRSVYDGIIRWAEQYGEDLNLVTKEGKE